MSYLLNMLDVLIVGVAVLIAGSFILNKGQGLNPQKAFQESLGWGAGFLFSFSIEFIALVRVI